MRTLIPSIISLPVSRWQINRNFGAFIAYQYDSQILNSCVSPSTFCTGSTDRNVVTFGASWHFQPIRLD